MPVRTIEFCFCLLFWGAASKTIMVEELRKAQSSQEAEMSSGYRKSYRLTIQIYESEDKEWKCRMRIENENKNLIEGLCDIVCGYSNKFL